MARSNTEMLNCSAEDSGPPSPHEDRLHSRRSCWIYFAVKDRRTAAPPQGEQHFERRWNAPGETGEFRDNDL
jgi:hypothetical protein